ncbi:MAG: MBL fold metallo-hydrolase [Candidatus Solibacter sp.]|jgi:glyoxylase-like metal-dependent hydrolase (beta-lactamase superfamily II)
MKLTEGIHYVSQSKGGHVHAFLLDDGKGLTLIDALYDSDAGLLLEEIGQMGRQPSDLKNTIITHAHRSHIGGVAALKKLSNATVYSHEWEAGILDGSRAATKVSWFPKLPLQAYYLQLGLALGFDNHVPCRVDQSLKEGDHVGPLTIVSTPGHTPGCLSFSWPEKKALFVGDVIVTWPRVEAGWAGLTLDMKQNVKSVGKLSDFGSVELVAVGHGEPIPQGGIEVLKKLREQKV